MKILIDISQMAYAGTGVGRYTYELVRALLSLPTPYEFILWAGVRRQKVYFEKLQSLSPWNKATWLYSQVSPKLAGILFNYSPLQLEYLATEADVIHLSDWTAPVTRGPAITTIHDLAFIKHPETVDPLIRITQSARLNRVVKHKNTIIADSMSTKNDLVEIYHLDPTLIKVIYPGISTDYYPKKKTEIERVKTKYNLPDQFILSLGTKEPRKNLERLIQATKDLSLPLIIAGKYGWGKQLGDATHVKAIGFVKEEDLPALYSAATLFVYPSLYEGFGFPALEAMACGTPVVTSNTSSLPEVVGTSAVLVDPLSIESIKAGISKALIDKKQLIKSGLLQAQKFTWEKTAKQVLEVYETINRN